MGWKINVRSSRMKVWIIRGTAVVLLWTCLVQLITLRGTWGPRVLKGWPSSVNQDSHSLDVKFLPADSANKVLPPKSKSFIFVMIMLDHKILNIDNCLGFRCGALCI